MKQINNMKHISLRIDGDLLDRLDKVANSYSMTRNSLICYLISQHCNTQEKVQKALSEDNIKEIIQNVVKEVA